MTPLPPEQTGIADYAAALRNALERDGIQVSTPLQALPREASREHIRRTVTEIDWSAFDVVHVELGGGQPREFVALETLQTQSPTPPLTLTVHDPERLVWRPDRLPLGLDHLRRYAPRLYQAAILATDPLTLRRERRVAKGCDRLVALTEKGALALGRRMDLPVRQIVVIPHGTADIVERALPVNPPVRVLYFGFLCRGKGIEDLITAVAHLVNREPLLGDRITLTLAGGQAPEMAFGHAADYVSGIRQRVAALGLSRQINVHTNIPADDIPNLIQRHHVVVLPYQESRKLAWLGRQYGTSGALAWANACGRGVLASNARAFDEELSRGNGRVFPSRDPFALAECLSDLCQRPAILDSWAKAAARLGRERQWTEVGRRFQRLWNDVLRTPRHAH
ncbi:MAG: glycosyltransferase [Acidiferrobacteraceae bacterium]